QGTAAAVSRRIASGEDGFAYFCQDKSKPRDSEEALYLICALAVNSFSFARNIKVAKRQAKKREQVQGFRPLRVRVPFGWTQKEPKGPFAGREPAGLRPSGSLRSSPDTARSPNSLRSDMGCSSAAPGSGARLALRLD
ncbi:hypothetical protein, partial [Luteimonas terrae]|uniref:hypothetical protein n=1 Tax=Luteimonas terrae TaxID=1530191 RepID=UPI00286AC7A6